jgi:hypothetical protein
MQTVSRQRVSKRVLASRNTNVIELLLATRSVQSGYKEDNWGHPVSCQCSDGSQPVKRRLRSWCEMAADLGVVSWDLSSAREAEEIWRFSSLVICRLRVEFCTGNCKDRTGALEAEESPLLEVICQGTAGEDTASWKRLSGYCALLWPWPLFQFLDLLHSQ